MAQEILAVSTGYLEAEDGEQIFIKSWLPGQVAPKALIQVAHGLGENADYYEEFGQVVAGAGYGVYLLEARGHGRTAGDITTPEYKEKGGDIGEDGFAKIRDDHHRLTNQIKHDHPGLPVFFLGHSFGSVIARLYAIRYGSEIDGLILTGAGSASASTDELLKIVEKEIAANGPKAAASEAFVAIFGNLNKPFEPRRTELDWITSDNAAIDWSLQQPYTYILFNNRFYLQSGQAQKAVADPENLARIPADLPLFLLSGERDVITNFGKDTLNQAAAFKRAGVKDVQVKLYEQVRHSILREVNRAEVVRDILAWIESHQPAR